MHIGYEVYYLGKGIGEKKWGVIARFSLSQEDEAVEMVNLLKSGEIITSKFGWLDPEKYDFGYNEAWW